jgi:hypothetical protein
MILVIRRLALTLASVLRSRWDVPLSSNRTDGRLYSARARNMRCSCSPDNAEPWPPTKLARVVGAILSSGENFRRPQAVAG